MHAAYWLSPLLEEKSWLALTGYLAGQQMQAAFNQGWEPFLGRLTAPPSTEMTEVGELLKHHLQAIGAHLFEAPPRTLIHHDFDGDNLFFPIIAGEQTLTVIDWQLTTGAHPTVDVAWLIAGKCEPSIRRAHEERLVTQYHSLLVKRGVSDYPLGQCWDDYRLAMFLPAARIASAVGMSPGPVGGFWDVVFPRYCQAIHDLDVAELL